MCRLRSVPESRDHGSKASVAARTAASTWSIDAAPTRPMTSSVAGFTTSHVSPAGATAAPPIKRSRVCGTQWRMSSYVVSTISIDPSTAPHRAV